MALTSDKYIERDEEIELFKALSQAKERDCLLIELALYSGARESELIKIEVSDLNLSKMSVFIKHPLKGSNSREVPLPKEFFNRLASFIKDKRGRIFPISDSRVRQIWMSIRPFDKSFHSLRHTFARKQYARKPDILIVQKLLGHKSVASTMIYTERNYEVDQLREVMGL
jgi:integrase